MIMLLIRHVNDYMITAYQLTAFGAETSTFGGTYNQAFLAQSWWSEMHLENLNKV